MTRSNSFVALVLLIWSASILQTVAEADDEATVRAAFAKAVIDGKIPIRLIPAESTAKEDALKELLQRHTSMRIDSVPLETALNSIASQHRIDIRINESELKKVGINGETKVSVRATETRLRSALSLLLEPIDLAFIVRNDVLEVTTSDDAETSLVNEVYLLPPHLRGDISSVLNIIQQSVEPDSWLSAGGSNCVLPIKDLIVVSAPTSTHYKVQDLLSKLGKLADKANRPGGGHSE